MKDKTEARRWAEIRHAWICSTGQIFRIAKNKDQIVNGGLDTVREGDIKVAYFLFCNVAVD